MSTVKEYILDLERAKKYWDLCFPDWEGPVYLFFLLFLDYKIQGGEGCLRLYGDRYRVGLLGGVAAAGLIPIGLHWVEEAEGKAFLPRFLDTYSSDPWLKDFEDLNRKFMKIYNFNAIKEFSKFFEEV